LFQNGVPRGKASGFEEGADILTKPNKKSGLFIGKYSKGIVKPFVFEEEVVNSQLNGLQYLIYRGISEFVRRITPERFELFLCDKDFERLRKCID
jgi:hypothetical protein